MPAGNMGHWVECVARAFAPYTASAPRPIWPARRALHLFATGGGVSQIGESAASLVARLRTAPGCGWASLGDARGCGPCGRRTAESFGIASSRNDRFGCMAGRSSEDGLGKEKERFTPLTAASAGWCFRNGSLVQSRRSDNTPQRLLGGRIRSPGPRAAKRIGMSLSEYKTEPEGVARG
jgi:hypothetical protein